MKILENIDNVEEYNYLFDIVGWGSYPKEISKKVSKEFPFVRVDFYEYKNRAILGELTFTPAACKARYTKEASLKLGNMLEINEKDRKKETK